MSGAGEEQCTGRVFLRKIIFDKEYWTPFTRVRSERCSDITELAEEASLVATGADMTHCPLVMEGVCCLFCFPISCRRSAWPIDPAN